MSANKDDGGTLWRLPRVSNDLTEAQHETLDQWLQPGVKLRMDYGLDNINNDTIEIRGIVDDVIVYRWRMRKSQEWAYALTDRLYFELRMLGGHLAREGGDDAPVHFVTIDGVDIHIKPEDAESVLWCSNIQTYGLTWLYTKNGMSYLIALPSDTVIEKLRAGGAGFEG